MSDRMRTLIHLPVGAINAWFFILNPHLGWSFLLMFLFYELNEDWRLNDSAYIDVEGWLWGFALFIMGWVAYRFLGG